jgi:hypothetical protein
MAHVDQGLLALIDRVATFPRAVSGRPITALVGKLTYYERWIVAFANILFPSLPKAMPWPIH